MNKSIEILDCTLRDGSYPVNYAYSISDTISICKSLESAGIENIEVGHGMGLGASLLNHGESIHSDLEYIAAAVDSVKGSSIGVFAIAGLATTSQLREARRAGINFVRIGADVDKLGKTIELLECAKELGLRASLNMMKTYAYTKEEVLSALQDLLHIDIETVSIVDSAGTMLPNQVADYVEFLSKRIAPKIGFHGHNNLQLAIANSLSAANAGASVVDATMRGIGRSSGNAQIEVLVPVLGKSGFKIDVNYRLLSNFTDLFFQEPYPRYGIDGIELACGVSGLHSSFLPQLVEYANTNEIDLLELIEEVTKVSLIEVSNSSLLSANQKIKEKGNLPAIQNHFLSSFESHGDVYHVVDRIRSLARKFGKKSVMTFSNCEQERDQIKGITFYGDFVIGHAQVDVSRMEDFLDHGSGRVEFLGVDISLKKRSSHQSLHDESVFIYDEEQIIALLVSSLITNLRHDSGLVKVKMHGALTKSLLPNFTNSSFSSNQSNEISVTLVTERITDPSVFNQIMNDSDHLVFIRSEDIPKDFEILGNSKVHRLESRRHFDGNIVSLIESLKPSIFVNQIKRLGDIEIVSSGLVAPIGTIVVDDAQNPTCILGVASGHGTLLNHDAAESYAKRLQIANELLLEIKLRLARSGD
jgi:4-hydroxy-2-oxovalerate aldolase